VLDHIDGRTVFMLFLQIPNGFLTRFMPIVLVGVKAMKGQGIGFLVLGLLTIVTTCGIAAQKASAPKSQDKVALGDENVKQLLLLIDTDKNSKISKQEFMAFVEAEFKRLDKNKDGDLDVKELTRSEIQSRHPAPPSSAVQK